MHYSRISVFNVLETRRHELYKLMFDIDSDFNWKLAPDYSRIQSVE